MLEKMKDNANTVRARGTVEALNKKGFRAVFAATAAEARELVLQEIPEGSRVGFGGSITTRQLDLVEGTKAKGCETFDHWQPGLTTDQANEIRQQQLSADVFVTSVNAITSTGELVNVDGMGNRAAATIYGPKKVVAVVGINKLVASLEAAMQRSRHEAGVSTAIRLKRDTPCVKTGRCMDCSSPDRVCNVTIIYHRPPQGFKEFVVVVVGESLGF